MLILIMGDLGAGKTLYMLLSLISAVVDYGRKVWGNFQVNGIKEYRLIEPLDLKEAFNVDIFLDELQNWIDSFFSGSEGNLYMVNVGNQSQKRGINIFGTIHYWMSVDVRFRRNCNRLVIAERIGATPKSWLRIEDKRDFKYTEVNLFNYETNEWFLKYDDATKYFGLFDTFELSDPRNWEKLELGLLKDTSNGRKKLSRKLDEFALSVSDRIKGKITHASVSKALLDEGISLDYEALIYATLIHMRDE